MASAFLAGEPGNDERAAGETVDVRAFGF